MDRNVVYLLLAVGVMLSLSARRAWIEIATVAALVFRLRRSPQGERG